MEHGGPTEIRKASAAIKYYANWGGGNVGRVFLVYDPGVRPQASLKSVVGRRNGRRQAISLVSVGKPRPSLKYVIRRLSGVYDLGKTNGLLYFTMDYVEGESLEAVLKQNKRLSARKTARIIEQLSDALFSAHSTNIVHRDIKPANIIIDSDGNAHLTDFGLAREIRGGRRLSQTGTIAGSPSYMSPEQAQGKTREIEGRSDIFSLGSTFYEMLTGQNPFWGRDVMEVINKVINDIPIPPRQIYPQIPSELERICLKCLEKKKENRYPQASALAKDLRRYLTGVEKVAGPGSGALARQTIRRFIWGGMTALLAVALATAIFFWLHNRGLSRVNINLHRQIRQLETDRQQQQRQFDDVQGKQRQLQKQLQQSQQDNDKLQQQLIAAQESYRKLRMALDRATAELRLQPVNPKPANSTTIQTTEFRGDLARSGLYRTTGAQHGRRLRWKFKTKRGTFSSPTLASDTLYFGCDGGVFYAVDAQTGQLRWQLAKPAAIASSALVKDGVAYFGCSDGNFYAIATADASEKWHYSTRGKIVSSPNLVGEAICFGSLDGNLYALHQSTGKPVWRFASKGPIWSSPAVFRETVFCGSHDGNLYAIAADGSMRWHFQSKGSISGAPAVTESLVYFGSRDHCLYAVETISGLLKWKWQAPAEITCSPAVADGLVFCGSLDGNIYALQATDGRIKWKYRTDNKVFGSPTVADGLVYCGSLDNNLYALKMDSGECKWRWPTKGPIVAAPLVINGVVYCGSYDGFVYAISD